MYLRDVEHTIRTARVLLDEVTSIYRGESGGSFDASELVALVEKKLGFLRLGTCFDPHTNEFDIVCVKEEMRIRPANGLRPSPGTWETVDQANERMMSEPAPSAGHMPEYVPAKPFIPLEPTTPDGPSKRTRGRPRGAKNKKKAKGKSQGKPTSPELYPVGDGGEAP